MAIEWCGRADAKEAILEWKNSADPFLLLHVPDTQEIRDIRRWLEAQAASMRFAEIQRHVVDVLLVKSIFLKELAEELDGNKKFPSFYKEFNKDIGEYLSLSMKQEVGNHAQAGEAFSASDIGQHQNQNISVTQFPSLEKLREDNIENLFDSFLADFENFFSSGKIFILFRFLKYGFQGFSEETKQWFIRLCKSIRRKGRVKICIINQCDTEYLKDFIDTDNEIIISKYLSFNEILYETQDEAFCCGLAESPDGKVVYSEFKKRHAALLKRRAKNAS